MSGLFHTLNIGSQALFATRQGVDTTAHNIANAQTEGYSRQRVELTQRDPTMTHGVMIGNGVFIDAIKRSRDAFLEKQVNGANSSFGETGTRHAALLQLESIFGPEQGVSIDREMAQFFDSLQSLSSFPEDITVRTNVLERSKSLVSSFRLADVNLRNLQKDLNDQIDASLNDTNELLRNIANLNIQIKKTEANPKANANDLRDQRDVLVQKLSNLINIQYYEDGSGMLTVRGPGESLLVERGNEAIFGVRRDLETGMYDVCVKEFEGGSERNVTERLKGGQLQALITVRDKTIPTYLDHINELAYTFGSSVNEVHRNGFGLGQFSSSSGRDFFQGVGSIDRAARDIQVDFTIQNSTDAISVGSTANAPGDNVVGNLLINLQSQRMLDGGKATFIESYSNAIGRLGVETQRAEHYKEASELLLSDLKTRADAVSGVSLDEEASNMLKWQTSFTAASRVITTIDEMLDTILSLKR